MTAATYTETRDAVLAELRAAARAGRRCPTNADLRWALRKRGLTLRADCLPSALAYAGVLRVEVSGRNWRVVQIDGHRTAENPKGHHTYLTIDRLRTRLGATP